jgi:hypothetical protein
MMQQDWYGKVLDKDIIKPGNKVYGPDACLFVSQAINSLLNRQPKQGGKYPKGVRKYGNSGKFRVDMRKHKKHTHLGVFNSVDAAAAAYRNAKADWIQEHANVQACIKTRLALNLAADRVRSTP